jgi:hypothetical protein
MKNAHLALKTNRLLTYSFLPNLISIRELQNYRIKTNHNVANHECNATKEKNRNIKKE